MPAPAARPHDPDETLCRALVVACLGAFAWIFLPLIPADAAALGHDYSLILPNLLAGYYWYLGNGLLATPWFSPAQCGGVPFFADLTVPYYSFPQWASFAIGPTHAVRATFVVFAGLGAAGAYCLMRRRFAVAPPAAAVGAVLFLFSGFFAYRMAAGHLTFHPYTLVPWLAWTMLAPTAPGTRAARIIEWVWPAAAGGALLALMFHGGMIYALPVTGLAIAILLLVHGEIHGHRARPWLLFASAIALSLALSASRLIASMAFLENYPRAHYTLPGFAEPVDLLVTVIQALFWTVSAEQASARMTDIAYTLERHEWEYSLGPVALALLAAGAAAALARLYRQPARFARVKRAAPAWAGISLMMALPLLLNWHEPHWNSLMKSVPYLGSSSSMIRWFALYIPVLAALAALSFQALVPSGRAALAGAAVAALATIAWHAAVDKAYYSVDTYDGRRVEAGWIAARAAGRPPEITHVALLRDATGAPLLGAGRNDALVLGASQLLCYNPIFGYNLERLPFGPLKAGPALAEAAPGLLNIKNPACYVYPRENACEPGAHFPTARRDDARHFLGYRPYPFARSARQHAADAITLAAMVLIFSSLIGCAVLRLRRSREAGKN